MGVHFIREAHLNPILISLPRQVMYRGQNFPIARVNLAGLLPSTEAYLTYEGSTTFPGCWESVTWVVMNRPIYVTRAELGDMRLLMQGDKMQGRMPAR